MNVKTKKKKEKRFWFLNLFLVQLFQNMDASQFLLLSLRGLVHTDGAVAALRDDHLSSRIPRDACGNAFSFSGRLLQICKRTLNVVVVIFDNLNGLT